MQWQDSDAAVRELLAAALAARDSAYAPYSQFAVGAALRLWDGSIVRGCNVENASYGLTICAERVAVQAAVAEGRLAALLRSGRPARDLVAALAVVGELPEPLTPCGACRQVLAEFAAADCPVYCANTAGRLLRSSVGELLPHGFGFLR